MKPSLRRWFRRILGLALVVIIILGLRLTVFRPDPIPVSVYVVDSGPVEATVVNSRSGTVHSRREAEISPGTSGRVVSIPVAKGDRVKVGQLLLSLDNSVERAQVELSERSREAAASLAQEACVTAAQRARDLERARKLAQDGLVSPSYLESAETAAAAAESTCRGARERAAEAEASLRMARATLAKTTITAPFDGTLARVDAEVGEWIAPAAPGLFIPPVMTLVDLDHLYVSAPLDEVDLSRVAVGMPVRITLDSVPGREFTGTVTWKSPRVDMEELQNRTLEVEATFEDGADLTHVLPGASADVEIILESRGDVLRIPSYAVLADNSVLVLREGELRSVEVNTGLSNWAFAEITAGLQEGDAVVISLDRPGVKAGVRAVADTLQSP